jgi:esterase/lipase superfamily enzyme
VLKARAAVLGVVLTGLALAGCAGRPTGVLAPGGGAAAASGGKVDLLVATTRSATGATPGEMFTGERARGLAFADIAISIPPEGARQVGEVQWPSQLPANPATDFATIRAERLDGDQALRLFNAKLAASPRRSVLLFVHGYNTRFEEAVYRFAQIVHDSKADATPVLFTWPSRGKLLAYDYDRESASYSRDALEAALQAMAKHPRVAEINILAHSMGNWVTLEALRQMAIRDKAIAGKIKNVMLAAPDVDFDVFRRQIATMGEKRPNFTLFVSQDDAALRISTSIGGGQTRLGMIDPKQEPYRSDLEKARFNVVDLTEVKSSDRTNHGKFAQAPEVVQAIGQRLAQGQTLSDGRAGVGEKLGQVAAGAATTVGKAAGLVISAPIAIIDGRTREGLGDQVEDLGGHLGATVRAATGEAAARP